MFNVAQMTFPPDTFFINQIYYESIGYSIGAAVGAAFADPSRHVTVVIGDGSFQQTFQEISTMIRQNLKISIFVINNQGYTIERVINDNIYNG
jgi:TPP-dependent 2-oxoacid decarboxylase